MRTLAFVALGAFVTYATQEIRKRLIHKLEWKRVDSQLDQSLDDTMDASDAVAKY